MWPEWRPVAVLDAWLAARRSTNAPATSMPGSSTEAASGGIERAAASPGEAALTLSAAFVGLSLLEPAGCLLGVRLAVARAAALEVTLAFALLALVPVADRLAPGRLLMALATTLVVASKIAELTLRESLARHSIRSWMCISRSPWSIC